MVFGALLQAVKNVIGQVFSEDRYDVTPNPTVQLIGMLNYTTKDYLPKKSGFNTVTLATWKVKGGIR